MQAREPGTIIADRYVLATPVDPADPLEWRAVDGAFRRSVIMIFTPGTAGSGPAAAREADDEPRVERRDVLDGGYHEGEFYLVVSADPAADRDRAGHAGTPTRSPEPPLDRTVPFAPPADATIPLARELLDRAALDRAAPETVDPTVQMVLDPAVVAAAISEASPPTLTVPVVPVPTTGPGAPADAPTAPGRSGRGAWVLAAVGALAVVGLFGAGLSSLRTPAGDVRSQGTAPVAPSTTGAPPTTVFVPVTEVTVPTTVAVPVTTARPTTFRTTPPTYRPTTVPTTVAVTVPPTAPPETVVTTPTTVSPPVTTAVSTPVSKPASPRPTKSAPEAPLDPDPVANLAPGAPR